MGSCDVVGIRDGMLIGGGAIFLALACVTLSDVLGVCTLGSCAGVVGNRGCSTLGAGVSVASGFVVPWLSIGRRISRSF